MFKIMCLFITILSAAAVVTLAHECQNLEVLILYSSLSPESKTFMLEQLGPSYKELEGYIDIKLVPFGHAESATNGRDFNCDHGSKECKGNMLQSCIMAQTVCQPPQVKFVVCQMAAKDTMKLKKCVKFAGLTNEVEKCVNMGLGHELQLEAESLTKLYEPEFIPTIIYDNEFNQELQDDSLQDFRGTVCRLLRERDDIPYNSTVCS